MPPCALAAVVGLAPAEALSGSAKIPSCSETAIRVDPAACTWKIRNPVAVAVYVNACGSIEYTIWLARELASIRPDCLSKLKSPVSQTGTFSSQNQLSPLSREK